MEIQFRLSGHPRLYEKSHIFEILSSKLHSLDLQREAVQHETSMAPLSGGEVIRIIEASGYVIRLRIMSPVDTER